LSGYWKHEKVCDPGDRSRWEETHERANAHGRKGIREDHISDYVFGKKGPRGLNSRLTDGGLLGKRNSTTRG